MTDYKQIFDAITSDPRYQRNLDWGEARPGHPEATVRAHIAEVDRNLEALRHKLEGKGREPLRWFFEQVAGNVESKFTAADIL